MASGKPCSSTSGNFAPPTSNELATRYSPPQLTIGNILSFRCEIPGVTVPKVFAFSTWIYEADRAKIEARKVCTCEASRLVLRARCYAQEGEWCKSARAEIDLERKQRPVKWLPYMVGVLSAGVVLLGTFVVDQLEQQ